MIKRQAYTGGAQVPEGWQVSDTFQHGARVLTPGTMLTIKGERGARFRFVRFVSAPPAPRRRTRREWIDVVGGTPGVIMDRSFRPDRIARVLKTTARKGT